MTSSHDTAKRLGDLMPLIRERLAAGQTVKFFPRGTSMLPMLRQGVDQVELSPIPGRLKKYDLPLYQRESGQFVLHRVVEAGTTYTCVGDNQIVLERGLKHEQMIAVVTAFTRNGRRIEVTHPGYRLYCHIWCASRPLRHLWRGIRGRIKRKVNKEARRCLK